MEKMPIYYKCNMKKAEHVLVYIVCSILISVIAYLFYHVIWISVLLGFLAGLYLEKIYADRTVKKRRRNLRLQFKDFLGSMSVAVRAGNVEIYAIKSALDDLRLSYGAKADIIREVENIILQYSNYVPYDPNGYLNVDTQSGGEGLYITRGKAIDIHWTKDSQWGITHYYDSNNQEIQLNPGKTWVEIVLNDSVDSVILQ